MSPFAPERAAFRAGRLMLHEIEFQASRGADFGFETTLSGRGHLKLIRGLKDRGYQVHFFFIGLISVELALSRIRQRVLKGGHNIREADVRRRFDRSSRNFFSHYRSLATSWSLFDNSAGVPTLIALEQQGKVRIIEPESYEALVLRYGKSG
jgi:predicted ABC-type ATPase